MNPNSSEANIFKLPDPDNWYCKVISYPYAMTNLKIQADHPDGSVLFLEFRNIVYFSGWLSWKGIRFRVTEDEELLQFVRTTTSHFDALTSRELLSPSKLGVFKLFVGQGSENTSIRLIANAARSLDRAGQILVEPLTVN